METMRQSIRRCALIVIFLAGTWLTLGCGYDGATGTGSDLLAGSFSATYTPGEVLGSSQCKEGYELHACYVTLNWWTDMSEAVDSVIFWIPSNSAVWTESFECVSDGFVYKQEKGIRDGDHWRYANPAYGYLSHHPLTDLYFALEFMPDSLAHAEAYSVDGGVTMFTAQPTVE